MRRAGRTTAIALCAALLCMASAAAEGAARGSRPASTRTRARTALKRTPRLTPRTGRRLGRTPRRPATGTPRAWARQIAAGDGTVLIALDIDGVLAPIVGKPGRARIPRRTREALHRLAAIPGVELAFITGRAADSAEHMLGDLPGWRAVSHGLVVYRGGEPPPAPAMSEAERTALDEFRGWIRGNLPAGVRIEDKPTSTAIHFRELDAADPAEARRLFDLTRQAAGGRANLAVRDGRLVLEVGVLGHKDAALRQIAGLTAAGTTAFAGDDVTDEPAIAAAARSGGVGLFVRSRETRGPPPGASGTLAGTRGVQRWLTALATELGTRTAIPTTRNDKGSGRK
jgi:trehalose 6-phosphate phosphatase